MSGKGGKRTSAPVARPQMRYGKAPMLTWKLSDRMSARWLNVRNGSKAEVHLLPISPVPL